LPTCPMLIGFSFLGVGNLCIGAETTPATTHVAWSSCSSRDCASTRSARWRSGENRGRPSLLSKWALSGNGDENGSAGPGIVQCLDRKSDEPEDIAGLAFPPAPAMELEFDSTRFDLDKTIPPLTLVKHKAARRRQSDNSEGECCGQWATAQTQAIRIGVPYGHSCSGNVMGKPKAGNKSGPNVVISTIRASSMAKTSSVAARCSDSPQARM
jgi:hypothetical protein